MPAPVLTVPVPPRRDMGDARQSRATVVAFGDGYAQASAPVNPWRRTLRPSWRLTAAQADDLVAFLTARAGAERFEWAPPGEAARLWLCPAFSAQTAEAAWRIVEATFEEQH